jgi:hypothetical protein
MSVNYNVTVRTNRLQQVVNAIDAGASNGFMRLLDNHGNVTSSLQLSRPCGTAANGILTFNGMPLLDAAAVGSANPVNSARFEDSTGNIIISGLTVGGANGGYDIAITPSTIINAGQTVVVTAATITGN